MVRNHEARGSIPLFSTKRQTPIRRLFRLVGEWGFYGSFVSLHMVSSYGLILKMNQLIIGSGGELIHDPVYDRKD